MTEVSTCRKRESLQGLEVSENYIRRKNLKQPWRVFRHLADSTGEVLTAVKKRAQQIQYDAAGVDKCKLRYRCRSSRANNV